MNRFTSATLGSLAVLALAAPVSASPDGSTYVPRHGVDPAPYSVQHTATQRAAPTARGGGPTAIQPQHGAHVSGPKFRASSHSLSRIHSDNQTRRPGAVNYTGSSFKPDGDAASTHGVPDSTPVSLAGDHFESHTGARTTGRIATRAASSNERDVDTVKPEVPTARGGGPTAGPYVVAPGGQVEMLAPSRPVVWGEHMPRLDPKAQSAITPSDLRYLPAPGDGTARRAPGLLSMTPTTTSRDLIDNTGVAVATPSDERSVMNAPARAIGGGPRASSRPSGRAIDSNGR